MTKVYFHVDLDAFFASVEQLDHPEYRNKPVIVGGRPEERRSVVSTCSYEARKYGVHSAMSSWQAGKLCPQGIFVPPDMKRYLEKSREVMAIFYDYSPDVQQMSIDEAFIDMTGTEKLFGTAEEAARKLKKDILDKTGLTVSVGIASTKYCAKISSGMNKPDGLFYIPPGCEQDFMLKLPMDKLWGAGKKTQERLKKSGFNTTKDIYNRSLSLLQSIFGPSTGQFLYNAVRGMEYEDFNSEPKSRSISAETTYEFDLCDINSIETALLELCQTVYFRSLKEKVISRSISIKIRYEDFTTITVQETSQRYISSSDDLFDRIKLLFTKKYNGRMGIRLFGVCMQNLEDGTKPQQGELFDFGEEKKRLVEEAVLKASQKNPSLKITKARLLEKGFKTFGAVLVLFSFFSFNKLHSQSIYTSSRDADGAAGITFDTSNLPPEEINGPVRLLDSTYKDNEIQLETEGFWKSSLTSGASVLFKDENSPEFSFISPVFEQNVDLSAWFMINKTWYFEAAFADKFDKNTVTLGYQGQGYLKHGKISNRNIVFPSFYSVSDFNRGIGGGTNQAPGIQFNFSGDKWQSDFVLRFDLLSTQSKSWYGKNALTENTIQLTDYDTGSQYVLPSRTLLQNIKNVYVENIAGSFKDSKGRKYVSLSDSSYLKIASQNLLVISKESDAARKNNVLPALAVSFTEDFSESELQDFLQEVQDLFSEIDLQNYYYTFTSEINNEKVLFLQHHSGFSPFMDYSRYDGGVLPVNEAAVASQTTGIIDSSYTAEITDTDSVIFSEKYFNKGHLWIDIINNDDKSFSSVKTAAQRFPFAREYPQVYLNNETQGDLCLKLKSYTPVSRFDIGTRAVPGTVAVYKNSIQITDFQYDPATGTLNISSGVSVTDHIKAQWQEEDENSDETNLALAMGWKYNFSEKTYLDLSLSSRLPYSLNQDFADNSHSSSAYGTAAAGFSWQNDLIEFKNSLGFTAEKPCFTDSYRILGMNDYDGETRYLSKNAAPAAEKNYTPVLKKRPDSSEVFPTLQENVNRIKETKNGLLDSGITGYAIPVEWQFNASDAASPSQWASRTISISDNSNSLSNAEFFEIALKNTDPQVLDFDLYLQLGVSDTKDYSINDEEKISCWKLTDSASKDVIKAFNPSLTDSSKNNWQIVQVRLSQVDRALLSKKNNSQIRLIVLPKDGTITETNLRGTVLTGPYATKGSSFVPSVTADAEYTIYETTDYSLTAKEIKKFNSGKKNKVQNIEYKIINNVSPLDLKFSKSFSPSDFSGYKKLSFYFKAESETDCDYTFNFYGQYNDRLSKAMSFTFSEGQSSQSWQKITVDLTNKKAFYNGHEANVFYDSRVVPSTLEINITATVALNGSSGLISIDELYLSECISNLVLQDKASFKFQKDGVIFSTESLELLKDFSFDSEFNSSVKLNANPNADGNAFSGRGSLKTTVSDLEIKLEGAKNSLSDNDNILDSASHFIKTEKSILNVLDFSENYSFNSITKDTDKENQIKLDFSSLKVPVKLSLSSKATESSWSKNQEYDSKLDLNLKKFKFNANAVARQKTSGEDFNGMNYENGYFAAWKSVSQYEFSKGEKEAVRRNILLSSSFSYSFDYLKMTPSLSLTSKGNYHSLSSDVFNDATTVNFTLPFTLKKQAFSLNYERKGGSEAYTKKGGDYFSDLQNLQERTAQEKYIYSSIPFYELFDSKNISVKEANFSYYNCLYSLKWKKSFSGNRYDLFIPSSLAFELEREIKSAETQSDIKYIRQKVNYTAMNIFGKNGSIPVFDFFQQDEYLSSLSLVFKTPGTKKTALDVKINGYQQISLFLNDYDSLKFALEGTFENKNNWDEKTTLVWKRNASSSLAKGIYLLFVNEENKACRITKTDSLNFCTARVYSTYSIQKKFSLDYTHQTDTEISKYVTINTQAGLGYNQYSSDYSSLNGTLTLGATVKF